MPGTCQGVDAGALIKSGVYILLRPEGSSIMSFVTTAERLQMDRENATKQKTDNTFCCTVHNIQRVKNTSCA